MAKFSAHGGLRLRLNGGRTSFGCELKDPFRSRAGGGRGGGKKKRLLLESPFGIHRGSGRGGRLSGLGRVCSHGKKSSEFKSEERLKKDGGNGDQEEDEMDFDEFESDEFSCFRGLVLDLSYRSVTFFRVLFFLFL